MTAEEATRWVIGQLISALAVLCVMDIAHWPSEGCNTGTSPMREG